MPYRTRQKKQDLKISPGPRVIVDPMTHALILGSFAEFVF
jgi:hypothetical protein